MNFHVIAFIGKVTFCDVFNFNASQIIQPQQVAFCFGERNVTNKMLLNLHSHLSYIRLEFNWWVMINYGNNDIAFLVTSNVKPDLGFFSCLMLIRLWIRENLEDKDKEPVAIFFLYRRDTSIYIDLLIHLLRKPFCSSSQKKKVLKSFCIKGPQLVRVWPSPPKSRTFFDCHNWRRMAASG